MHKVMHMKLHIKKDVLGLAKMELISPTAVLMVLSFALVARRVLITHQCFDYC